MALPPLTAGQRAAALAKAAEVRHARAAVKAGIKAGKVDVTAVLADENGPLWLAHVRQVLEAVPGVGKVRAAELMSNAGIDSRRRVRGLGPVQRAKLTEALAA
jgi:hypothetical protein